MALKERQEALCRDHGFESSDLKAFTFNCALKPSPRDSRAGCRFDHTNPDYR